MFIEYFHCRKMYKISIGSHDTSRFYASLLSSSNWNLLVFVEEGEPENSAKRRVNRGMQIRRSVPFLANPPIRQNFCPNPKPQTHPRIRSIYRTNPQSVGYIRPNPSIRKPINPPRKTCISHLTDHRPESDLGHIGGRRALSLLCHPCSQKVTMKWLVW